MSSAEDLQLCDIQGKKRERYDLLSPKEKVQIGKRAAEHGVQCNSYPSALLQYVYCVHGACTSCLCTLSVSASIEPSLHQLDFFLEMDVH